MKLVVKGLREVCMGGMSVPVVSVSECVTMGETRAAGARAQHQSRGQKASVLCSRSFPLF